MKRFEELEIYISAGKLADSIWDICLHWDHHTRIALGRQLCSAADSICANIAEGFGRYHFRDNLRFLYIARGSLEETRSWIIRAGQRQLITKDKYESLYYQIEILGKKLNANINSIKQLVEP